MFKHKKTSAEGIQKSRFCAVYILVITLCQKPFRVEQDGTWDKSFNFEMIVCLDTLDRTWNNVLLK